MVLFVNYFYVDKLIDFIVLIEMWVFYSLLLRMLCCCLGEV